MRSIEKKNDPYEGKYFHNSYIIKKFLYSDHEIFLRELVSNAVDASQKMKQLAQLGEYQGELGELIVDVSFDEKKKTRRHKIGVVIALIYTTTNHGRTICT